jgi:hypothetical protein
MYFTLPYSERRQIQKDYKKLYPKISYTEMLDDFNGVKQYGDGGTVKPATTNQIPPLQPKSQAEFDYRQKAFQDSTILHNQGAFVSQLAEKKYKEASVPYSPTQPNKEYTNTKEYRDFLQESANKYNPNNKGTCDYCDENYKLSYLRLKTNIEPTGRTANNSDYYAPPSQQILPYTDYKPNEYYGQNKGVVYQGGKPVRAMTWKEKNKQYGDGGKIDGKPTTPTLNLPQATIDKYARPTNQQQNAN